MQQFVMKPLGRAPLLAKLVATLGVVLVLEALAGIVFGYDLQTAPPLLPAARAAGRRRRGECRASP